LAKVLDKVELKIIAHYICLRRQHKASIIVDNPIFWSQSMDLEELRAANFVGPAVVSDDEELYNFLISMGVIMADRIGAI
jgi:hypothetical protein